MNVSLTPQLEELVRRKVESGLYNNASEVIREALRLLDERDQERAVRLQALRQAIEEGIISGEPERWETERRLRASRKRPAAGSQSASQ